MITDDFKSLTLIKVGKWILKIKVRLTFTKILSQNYRNFFFDQKFLSKTCIITVKTDKEAFFESKYRRKDRG